MLFATHFMGPINNIFATAGIFNLIFASKDRLQSLKFPLEYSIQNHVKQAKKRLAVAYALSIAGGWFHFVYPYVVWSPEQQAYIRLEDDALKSSLMGQMTVAYESLQKALGFFLLISFNVALSRKYREFLVEWKRKMRSNAWGRQEGPVSDGTLSKLLMAQSVLVLVGNVPVFVIALAIVVLGIPIYGHGSIGPLLTTVAFIGSYFNCTGNFFIYLLMSKSFRKSARQLLCTGSPATL